MKTPSSPGSPAGYQAAIFRPLVKWPLVILVFPLLNELLNRLVYATDIPLFLDSIFTAIAAAVFGIGPGLVVALLSNAIGEVFGGFSGTSLPFALCGMATAIIVGWAARTGRLSSPFHLALVLLGVSLANAIIGAFVAVFVFGGYTGVNIDVFVSGLTQALGNIFTAAFVARIPMNLVDKAFAVVAASLALRVLGSWAHTRRAG